MENIFVQISIVLVVATAIAAAIHYLKQPLIIGHIITGLIVGPYAFNILQAHETVETFSQIGVAILLFIIGLGLNATVVKEVGKIAAITGIGQVVVTVLAGFTISRLLGFSPLTSIYIAIAIAFSSTVIIMKLLADKKELGRLYGRIATGFLLVQDILAAVILIIVSAISREHNLHDLIMHTVLRGIGVAILFYLIAKYIVPHIVGFFAKSQELLFLFSVGWGLGVASLFYAMGLSIEIGALFAGVALASTPYSTEVGARMRPLQDFFVILFFIILGTHMVLQDLSVIIVPVLVLSALILIGNPLIIMILMGILGYRKKTSFKAGLAVAQISEFSLILVILGNRAGHISQEAVSIVTFVGMLTIAISTYLILYADQLYRFFAPYLSIFERKKTKSEKNSSPAYDVILFGYSGIGYEFARSMTRDKTSFIVVDYDPDVIERIATARLKYQYGDIHDEDFLSELNFEKAKLVISTIPDPQANAILLNHLKERNKDAIVVVTAHEAGEAKDLYELGALYVIVPDYLSSIRASSFVASNNFDRDKFIQEREKQLKYLTEREAIDRDPIVASQ